MNTKLKDFAKKHSFRAHMTGGLDSYDNYIGTDLNDAVVVVSRSRDSDVLSESNFEAAKDMLTINGVQLYSIERLGHWACGWLEILTVPADNVFAIKKAYEIHEALAEYPILDDSLYCEMENDDIQEQYESWGRAECREFLIKRLNLSKDTDNNDFEYLCRELFQSSAYHYGSSDICIREESFKYMIQNYDISKDNQYFQLLKGA